jgi:starch synthase
MFSAIGADFFDRARVFFKFDTALAHRIFAASDIFLMPSFYEPCGTGQMVAMRYGSIPVVRAVGGLADTVSDFSLAPAPADGSTAVMGNGFTFQDYDVNAFWRALSFALDIYADQDSWRRLQRRAMRTDFSWEAAAPNHVALYHRAIQLGTQ